MAKAKMIGYFKPAKPNKKADMWMAKQNHFFGSSTGKTGAETEGCSKWKTSSRKG